MKHVLQIQQMPQVDDDIMMMNDIYKTPLSILCDTTKLLYSVVI